MKQTIKSFLLKLGIQLNFTKNLWYKDCHILLKKFINKSNPLIFDVGASDGSSIHDFKKIFPASIIHSFEPYPTAYSNLTNTAKQYSDVYTHNLALSDNNLPSIFFVNKSKATNSLLKPVVTNSFIDKHAIPETQIEVKQNTLDNIVLEKNISFIDILKIDVQGGELKVLEGAQNTLSQKKVKYILTEIWFLAGYERQPLYHDIASYLSNFGFKPFGIYNIHYREDGHFLWGDAIFYSD